MARDYPSVEDFDPTVPDKSARLWFIYSGYGTVKTYHVRGPAITHFLRRTGKSKLYEWDPTIPGWTLLAAKVDHPPVCDHCGLSTMGHPPSWYTGAPDTSQPQRDLGQYAFRRKGKTRKLVDPLDLLFVCAPCHEGLNL